MEHQNCKLCLMDITDLDIEFDSEGVCNHCGDATGKIHNYQFSKDDSEANLRNLATKIKKGQRGEYDSILGLSGGVDSSYVAYLGQVLVHTSNRIILEYTEQSCQNLEAPL